MKLNLMITWLFIMVDQVNSENSGIQSENCIPFKAVIIWDTYTDGYRFFYYQRVFIVKLINEMPDNSKIYLKILGSDTTSFLHFDKDHLNDSWVEKIAGINDPAPFRNNSISVEIIRNDVFDILNTNMAVEYFFVVNECSEIEEEVIKMLKKQKTFVAFAGDTDSPAVWKRLSTSKKHLKNLNDDVHGPLGPFLDILCRDSLLMCDTDMYWNGFRCYRCSYICTSIPSEFCKDECPCM
ncbi:uncharacterized protein LOC132714067 [Ruditapes philippinarum]|uniref:uncharacterized protein LOC132714067 n=1 Tax=Ruditapes philippinarum TaxID=129788 RepID=UPI00295A5839|nr:uncharacterized protein LOC132714067 [Ruditapes philippinarum]